ncbi:MAG: cysteine desulfurase [Gemmatimonadetes bacterium]|nr:cysteine desulfurase [Gemmatimonadota bacterium]
MDAPPPVKTSAQTRPRSLSSKLDVERLRRDFPALAQMVNGRPLAYLDNAATSQKPLRVLDALRNYYEHDNANVHRGLHELSRRATDAYEGARARVATWIGASSPAEVIWTRGTTESINLVAASWGSANLKEGDEILVSDMEHHSNLVPWQLIAARTGAKLRFLELDDEGRLILDALPEILDGGRVRIAALSHVSNALGTINPIAEISKLLHEAGVLFLVDGAQGAAHHGVNVRELGVDFYACSGHKMCGPTGIGVLWGRRELLEGMPPYQGGGEMIDRVERDYSTWAALPHKFEAGTPNIAGTVGLHAAVDYLDEIGADAILAHEQALVAYALDRLREVPRVRLFGPSDPGERAGVVSFTVPEAHPHDVSTILDSEGIAIRAGHHCAQLVMRRFGVPATARASFYFYNTRDEVDRLVQGLETVRSVFGD